MTAQELRELFAYDRPPGPPDPPKPTRCPSGHDALAWVSPDVALCADCVQSLTPLYRLYWMAGALPPKLMPATDPSALSLAHALLRARSPKADALDQLAAAEQEIQSLKDGLWSAGEQITKMQMAAIADHDTIEQVEARLAAVREKLIELPIVVGGLTDYEYRGMRWIAARDVDAVINELLTPAPQGDGQEGLTQ